MYFKSEWDYIDSCVSKERVIAVDACITALLTTVLKSAATGDINEYHLSDGQTKIQKTYRSVAEVINAVALLRVLRQQFINELTPTVFRLVDSKNFGNPFC